VEVVISNNVLTFHVDGEPVPGAEAKVVSGQGLWFRLWDSGCRFVITGVPVHGAEHREACARRQG